MPFASALTVHYVESGRGAVGDSAARDTVLGVAAYASPPAVRAADVFPRVAVGLVPLPLERITTVAEIWEARTPMAVGRHGRVHCRHGGGWLYGCVQVPEIASGPRRRDALHAAVMTAYGEMFDCLHAQGLQRAVRIWNFLADINRDVDGVERYQVFNEARQHAFAAAAEQLRRDVPAASALGTPSGQPFTLYFIASDTPGTPLENPRQVAAYDYPPDYGTFSPTFARAALARGPDGPVLFVSGTASIVGHRTLHAGDAAAQTRETVANLAAVVQAANGHVGSTRFDLQHLALKVYVRHAADHPLVAAELERLAQPRRAPVYLQADICRSDLLVEIEAVATQGTDAS